MGQAATICCSVLLLLLGLVYCSCAASDARLAPSSPTLRRRQVDVVHLEGRPAIAGARSHDTTTRAALCVPGSRRLSKRRRTSSGRWARWPPPLAGRRRSSSVMG